MTRMPRAALCHHALMMRRSLVVLSLSLTACGSPQVEGDTGAATTSGTSTTPASTSSSTTTTTTTDTPTDPTSHASEGLGGTTGTRPTTGDPATTSSTSEPATTTGMTATTGTTDTTGQQTTDDSGLAPLLTLEHVQVKGTHNSYHMQPALPFDATHEYTHLPLAEQLETQGVRAFELDVHQGLSEFEVYHIAVIDPETTCGTLKGCLGQIQNWSTMHPLHLPVVVWIEIKDQTGGFPIDAADLDAMDTTIRGALAPERLFTPDDLQAGHPSVHAAIAQDGWPALDLMRGKVLVVLLNVEDDHADDYTAGYTTLAGRAMFARATPAQFTLPWSAIAKLGIGDDADITAAHAAHLLIATNVCAAGDADADCSARLAAAEAAGIHMLKDDFPGPIDGKAYFLDLPDGSPARCNPVTAPPGCTSALLESL